MDIIIFPENLKIKTFAKTNPTDPRFEARLTCRARTPLALNIIYPRRDVNGLERICGIDAAIVREVRRRLGVGGRVRLLSPHDGAGFHRQREQAPSVRSTFPCREHNSWEDDVLLPRSCGGCVHVNRLLLLPSELPHVPRRPRRRRSVPPQSSNRRRCTQW